MQKNESEHYRGLHLVIFNPFIGVVDYSQVFDTYKTTENFDNFIKSKIPQNFIIIAACMDECVNKLSLAGKQWFADMGSKEIWKVDYRCGFVFIGLIGQKQVVEKRAI